MIDRSEDAAEPTELVALRAACYTTVIDEGVEDVGLADRDEAIPVRPRHDRFAALLITTARGRPCRTRVHFFHCYGGRAYEREFHFQSPWRFAIIWTGS